MPVGPWLSASVSGLTASQPSPKRYGFAPNHVRKEIDDWLRWQIPKSENRVMRRGTFRSDGYYPTGSADKFAVGETSMTAQRIPVPADIEGLSVDFEEADIALAVAENPAEEREAVMLALIAVMNFLKSAELECETLHTLKTSLQNIDREGHSKLFDTSSVGAPSGQRMPALRARCAAAMQRQILSGKTKTEAAAVVAIRLYLSGLPKPVSAKTIARWRNRFASYPEEHGSELYRLLLKRPALRDACSDPDQR
jgi:hypothetical protein